MRRTLSSPKFLNSKTRMVSWKLHKPLESNLVVEECPQRKDLRTMQCENCTVEKKDNKEPFLCFQ